MDKIILDPETIEMVGFLGPEIVEEVDKSFMNKNKIKGLWGHKG